MNYLETKWPVHFRALLYVSLAVLPCFITVLTGLVDGSVKIVPWLWCLTFANAAYQGLLALRAYYDGSAQRASDESRAITGLTPPPDGSKTDPVSVPKTT
jgi:hypothetical protein